MDRWMKNPDMTANDRSRRFIIVATSDEGRDDEDDGMSGPYGLGDPQGRGQVVEVGKDHHARNQEARSSLLEIAYTRRAQDRLRRHEFQTWGGIADNALKVPVWLVFGLTYRETVVKSSTREAYRATV